MPSRHYRKNLRETQAETRTAYVKPPDVLIPKLTALSAVLPYSPAVITLEKLEQSQRLLFALEYSQTIINFYNTAYERILYLLDLVINGTDMNTVISYAYSLRLYVTAQIEVFSNIPGNSAKSELDLFQNIIFSILENIIKEKEMSMILSRITALQDLITKYKNS